MLDNEDETKEDGTGTDETKGGEHGEDDITDYLEAQE